MEQDVTIQDFSRKGLGLATVEKQGRSFCVEVAHSVIGDQLKIELYKKKRKGKLLQVLTPSSKRVEPRCSHATICGGCCWQQMDYQSQLEEKEKIIQKIFDPFLMQGAVSVFPMIPCKTIWQYRNKMEFSFSENRAGTQFLGLMIAQASTYVFNVLHCHLAKPWMSDVLAQTRTWWKNTRLKAFDPSTGEGHLRYLTMRHSFKTEQKLIFLTVSGKPEEAIHRTEIDSFVKQITQVVENPSIFIRVQQANKGSATQFFEMHLSGKDHILEKMNLSTKELTFKISPTSFFQPNTYQAEKLYQTCLDLVKLPQKATVYDLYAGTGTLGMAFSQIATKVVAIEMNAHAVCDAKENIEMNNIDNMTMYQGDVGAVLKTLPQETVDLVIVDPPRCGLDPKAIDQLKKIQAKQILYISCNPHTQAENIQELSKAGYQLKILQPIDQFPHTYHIENIALLSL